ncbi:MAG: serine acetyltransferase [candidate division Zixibacteria bacterium SM23_81]|nr:MAG: serine acetyltransferase [candidate division Zixibacteria bacterium SM23_81]
MPAREKIRVVARTDECQAPIEPTENFRGQLPEIVDGIVESCQDEDSIDHIDAVAIPDQESVIGLIEDLRDLLYPGYFGNQEIDRDYLTYHIGSEVNVVFEKLSHQIAKAIRHECHRSEIICTHCLNRSQAEAIFFLQKVPRLRKTLAGDVRAAYNGDPAAKSLDEIVFSYPATMAVTTYRIAHELYIRSIPLLPRMMTEYAHSVTGIDIHPGATIGENFFIDHGTAVVIGETTEIGNNVRIYQGVTLGAHGFLKDPDGSLKRGYKRHPTIEDDVIIYAGATILGGETVIGAGSIIGGNVWLTQSVPPGSHVAIEEPKLRIMTPERREGDR